MPELSKLLLVSEVRGKLQFCGTRHVTDVSASSFWDSCMLGEGRASFDDTLNENLQISKPSKHENGCVDQNQEQHFIN